MRAGLSQDCRLRKRSEYLHVQRTGKSFYSKWFIALVAPGHCRLGMTVSKKVGHAVFRNRVKRWVREYMRDRRTWIPADKDVVVIAKQSIRRATWSEICRDLDALEKKWALS